jgi:hypothetical protein
MRRSIAAILMLGLLGATVPARAAEGATGSAVGRVTVLRKGTPSSADPSWKVRFTPQAEGAQPLEVPLEDGVYETPELPLGPYQVQVVDAFGQAVGAPQQIVLIAGASRADLRLELQDGEGGAGSGWKVAAIVAGAAAALALAAEGGGDDDSPASPFE